VLLVVVAPVYTQAARAQEPVAALELLGELPADGAFAADGALVYLAEDRELAILDPSDPRAPREAGRIGPFRLPVRDVAVAGPIVYLATGAPQRAGTFHVLTASDPTAPQELAALDLPGEARGVALGEGRAYVWYSAESRGAFGVQVIDVADPSRPLVVAAWEPSSCRNGLAVADTRVLCTWAAKESSGGLWVIDAADLEQPQPAGSYRAPGLAFGFAVEGARAYVAWTTGGPSSPAAPGGLAIVDVSDPAHPQQSGAVQAGPALDVAVQDGYAFLGTAYRGLRMLDVRDTAVTSEVAAVQSAHGDDRITRVRVSGDRVYALRNSAGPPWVPEPMLWVLRFTTITQANR